MESHEGQERKCRIIEPIPLYLLFSSYLISNDDPLNFPTSPYQEWENKAAKMKDEYNKAVQEFERNGGGKDAGKGKKSKGAKKVVKKSKKKDSEDDDDESGEESD